MTQDLYKLAHVYEAEFVNEFLHQLTFPQHTGKLVVSMGKNISVLPDIQDVKLWIELKVKNRRVLYNDTGFSLRLFTEYMRVMEKSKKPILLFFRNAGEATFRKNFQGKNIPEDVVENFLNGEYGINKMFVDYFKNPIWYGGWLHELAMVRKENGVTTSVAKNNNELNVYFPLSKMRPASEVLQEIQTRIDWGW